MNNKVKVDTAFKIFMRGVLILAITTLIFIVLTPILSHSQELCNLYRNTIKCYKIIALLFIVIGLIGLYMKQQKKLSFCVLILGFINGFLSFLYSFSSACILIN
jgi:cytochrome bd-type quinol oxidase subunit 2